MEDHAHPRDVPGLRRPLLRVRPVFGTIYRHALCGTARGRRQRPLQRLQVAGELLAIDANGGAGLGLYVDSFTFPLSLP